MQGLVKGGRLFEEFVEREVVEEEEEEGHEQGQGAGVNVKDIDDPDTLTSPRLMLSKTEKKTDALLEHALTSPRLNLAKGKQKGKGEKGKASNKADKLEKARWVSCE